MAAETKMIEPFEPHQVRRSGNGGLISYGTSSYGLRRSLRERIQDLHEHQLDDRRSQAIRREELVDLVGRCIIRPIRSPLRDG
jgi:hypothetical protein